MPGKGLGQVNLVRPGPWFGGGQRRAETGGPRKWPGPANRPTPDFALGDNQNYFS